MRLTIALLFKKLPNGNIFRGKHRLEPKIRLWMKRELIDDIQREERNMFLLRHPFLSKEQVAGYAVALGKRQAFVTQKKLERASNLPGHIRLEDQLCHLRHLDGWEK